MIAAYAEMASFTAIESFTENRLLCGAVLPGVGVETTLLNKHKAA